MEVLINTCYGGFSISPAAQKLWAKLQGRKCYFFHYFYETGTFIPVKKSRNNLLPGPFCFDVPNPGDFYTGKETNPQKIEKENIFLAKHNITNRPENRSDPLLIKAVKTLGEKESSGSCAKLKIVTIPDGIEYEITEYDGIESIHELHRRWS